MKNPAIMLLISALLSLTLLSQAAAATLEERLADLERRQSELYHTLAEKKAAGLATPLGERLTFSGLLEVEATAASRRQDDGRTQSSSDLVLATTQLGLGMTFTDRVRGSINFLYEEDTTDLEVDEASVDLNLDPFFARIGRIYLPFGVYHSHFISDPLTLELGETRETAALLGYGRDLFSLSLFAFNGDSERLGEEDHLRDWGTSLIFTPRDGIEFGGSYLSDLADSDAAMVTAYERRVAGWSAFVLAAGSKGGISAEILGATRAFAAADLDGDGNGMGDRPRAWNVEAFWTMRDDLDLALRWEGSDKILGQPRRQYGLDLSWSPWPYATLSLEYLRGEFSRGFGLNEDGSGLYRRDQVTAQLALAF